MTNHLRFFGSFCDASFKLEEIKAFHHEFESQIENENLKLNKIKIEYDNDPALYNKKYHYENTLAGNLRGSVIISLVTFLEIELQHFCSNLQSAFSINVSYGELKGTTLEQFKIYSKKLCLLDLDFESVEWQSVKEVVELRNCIVHHDSIIEDFYGRRFNRVESIQNLSKKFNSIQITEGFVQLKKDSCFQCISIVETFINMIYNCVLRKFPDEKGNTGLIHFM
jgi:hypothetical protein